jgi:hypothetical protein
VGHRAAPVRKVCSSGGPIPPEHSAPENGEGGDIASFLFEQHIPGTNATRYKGKTVMLIDERAISHSEHSGLFYKAANGTVFIGSPATAICVVSDGVGHPGPLTPTCGG